MLQCEGFSSKLRYDFEIPNGENVRNWVANMIIKFYDERVRDHRFSETSLVGCGKKKGF